AHRNGPRRAPPNRGAPQFRPALWRCPCSPGTRLGVARSWRRRAPPPSLARWAANTPPTSGTGPRRTPPATCPAQSRRQRRLVPLVVPHVGRHHAIGQADMVVEPAGKELEQRQRRLAVAAPAARREFLHPL